MTDEKKTADNISQRYLCFSLGRDLLAMNLDYVKEVIAPLPLTPIPQTPPEFKGILNLRGVVIPVIDLEMKVFKRNTKKEEISNSKTIIIVEHENTYLGLLVDEVNSVSEFTSDQMSSIDKGDPETICKVAKQDERLILILNPIPFLVKSKHLIDLKKAG